MKRFWIGALLSMALAGCLGGGTEVSDEAGGEMEGLTVNVRDSTGAPYGADTVYWSYVADAGRAKASHGEDTAMKPALRLNAEGTRWALVAKGLHGAVFVRARRTLVDPADSLCLWKAYTQLEASAATLPATLDLLLKPMKECR